MERSLGGDFDRIDRVHGTLCREGVPGLLIDGAWTRARHRQVSSSRTPPPPELSERPMMVAALQKTHLQIDGVQLFHPETFASPNGTGGMAPQTYWVSKEQQVLDLRFPNGETFVALPGLLVPSRVLLHRLELTRGKARQILEAAPVEVVSAINLVIARLRHAIEHNILHDNHNPYGVWDLDDLSMEPVPLNVRKALEARLCEESQGEAVNTQTQASTPLSKAPH